MAPAAGARTYRHRGSPAVGRRGFASACAPGCNKLRCAPPTAGTRPHFVAVNRQTHLMQNDRGLHF